MIVILFKSQSVRVSEVIIPIIPPLETIMAELSTPYSHGGLVFPFLLGEGVDPDSIHLIP